MTAQEMYDLHRHSVRAMLGGNQDPDLPEWDDLDQETKADWELRAVEQNERDLSPNEIAEKGVTSE